MKLQIAFDSTDIEKSIETAIEVAPYADIIEIGSPLIYKYGMKAIELFREKLPKKILLSDTKITEHGKDLTELVLNSGSDWITVMAGTAKDVIHTACTEAHNLSKKVMLDLTDSFSAGQSALEAKSLGVDAILFHQVYDVSQPLLFLDKWDMVKNNTTLPIFVSGKIKRENIDQIIEIKPDGIIIGKAITSAQKPIEEAKFFYDLCNLKRS